MPPHATWGDEGWSVLAASRACTMNVEGTRNLPYLARGQARHCERDGTLIHGALTKLAVPVKTNHVNVRKPCECTQTIRMCDTLQHLGVREGGGGGGPVASTRGHCAVIESHERVGATTSHLINSQRMQRAAVHAGFDHLGPHCIVSAA